MTPAPPPADALDALKRELLRLADEHGPSFLKGESARLQIRVDRKGGKIEPPTASVR